MPSFNFKCDCIFCFVYIYSYWRIIRHCFMFFEYISKYSWIYGTKYNPSNNSNLSFQIGADILNVLLLYDSLIFFHGEYMLRFHKATYLSFDLKLFYHVLSLRLRIHLSGADVLLFWEVANIVPFLYHNFIELVTLLYTFWATLFAWFAQTYDLMDLI